MAEGWRPAVNFHHGFVSDLVPGKFDCVIISEVLEHLDHLDSSSTVAPVSGRIRNTDRHRSKRVRRVRVGSAILWRVAARKVGWVATLSFWKGKSQESVAGSEDQSPHVQRFTLSRLRQMFERNGLVMVEYRGTSMASGPFMAHLFGKFKTFIHLNASIADHVPLAFAAGWMFALRRAR